MPYAKSAVFWFIGLLAILMIGFWESYFSIILSGPESTHHFHGLAMLAWVLLLINQAWLVRSKKLALHRTTGKLSYLIAPLVVISGVMVSFHNVARFEDPSVPAALSIFHLGLASVFVYGVLYTLAMVHRKNVQYHARYMIATALVFLVPGLSRTLAQYVEPTGLPSLDFYQTLYVPLVIGLVLIGWEWYRGKVRSPFVVFSALWGLTILFWHLLPLFGPWQRFTVWAASLGV